jgi:hypothetical protein
MSCEIGDGRTLLSAFKKSGRIMPELSFVVSVAVGFAVSIYDKSGKKKKRYQVMRWDEGEGPGYEFWDWHLWHMPQFFDTPDAAAAAFVESWLNWCEEHS